MLLGTYHCATMLGNRKAMMGDNDMIGTTTTANDVARESASCQWALNIIRGTPLNGRKAAHSGKLAAVWAIIGDYMHDIAFSLPQQVRG